MSELTWLTHQRPAELEECWAKECPEVSTASAKLAALEVAGYSPVAYFALPESWWLDHYYRPLQRRFAAFLDRHHPPAANDIVEAEQHEIDLYRRFSAFVSYGFYIATRLADGQTCLSLLPLNAASGMGLSRVTAGPKPHSMKMVRAEILRSPSRARSHPSDGRQVRPM